jgi:hypothetical protein
VLRHLNYKPWFAMAEFVDNSVQSFLDRQGELEAAGDGLHRVRVAIELDEDGQRITIRDDAAGIHEKDYARAFRPAALPPDRTGLAEFGMGMKSDLLVCSPMECAYVSAGRSSGKDRHL